MKILRMAGLLAAGITAALVVAISSLLIVDAISLVVFRG